MDPSAQQPHDRAAADGVADGVSDRTIAVWTCVGAALVLVVVGSIAAIVMLPRLVNHPHHFSDAHVAALTQQVVVAQRGSDDNRIALRTTKLGWAETVGDVAADAAGNTKAVAQNAAARDAKVSAISKLAATNAATLSKSTADLNTVAANLKKVQTSVMTNAADIHTNHTLVNAAANNYGW